MSGFFNGLLADLGRISAVRFGVAMDRFVYPWKKKWENQSDSMGSRAFEQSTDNAARNGFCTAPGTRVLIADGDAPLCGFLSSELEEQGFQVSIANDGEQAYSMLLENVRHNLLIVALNLPRLDGFGLIERVRMIHPRLPILVLTVRTQIEDKVTSFQLGADDYVTKPFSMIELQARIHALTRRNSGAVPRLSIVGDLSLDRETRRIERNCRRIDLTPREFAILEVMMRTPGCPVTRTTLLDLVWNTTGEPSTNIVDVYVKYVRDKVDGRGEPRLIHTIRGIGYEIREAPRSNEAGVNAASVDIGLQLEPCNA